MSKKTLAMILGTAVFGTSVAAVTFGGSALYRQTALSQTDEASLNIAEESAEEASDPADAEMADDLNEPGFVSLSTAELATDDAGNEIPAFSYSNVADVAEAVMPSVVAITNKSVQEINTFFYRRPYQFEATSAGSGIIVGSNDTELLICTNNHVVEDADQLSVTFIDDESYPAYIKGTDPENDLAVVAVETEDISDETMEQLRIAKIGNSDDMRVGEQVVAIGNALGYGQSVTTGIISAKNRSITAAADSYGSSETVYEDLIQTDAAINFGNSGGALLNMNGEVIGINSAKASQSGVEGMGYSIPVGKAMPILEELMTRQTRMKLSEEEIGYVGINGQSVGREATMLYGIPEGIYITYVAQDSPADQAGLEEGDILMEFDGEAITSMSDLQYLLQYYKAGETVELGVANAKDGDYSEKTYSITLGDRSALQ